MEDVNNSHSSEGEYNYENHDISSLDGGGSMSDSSEYFYAAELPNNVPSGVKMPVYNAHAENAIVCCLMLDSKNSDVVFERLKINDFYQRETKIIFAAMQELYDESKPLDFVTLRVHLTSTSQYDDLGGDAVLSSYTTILPHSRGLERYVEVVRNASLIRKLQHAAEEIQDKAANYKGLTDEKISELIDAAEKSILAVAEEKSEKSFEKLNILAHQFIEQLTKQMQNTGVSGLTSGYQELDRILTGFKRGDFIIIAGRPSMGKTAFALNVALNACNGNKREIVVGILSMEMSSVQISGRLASISTGIGAKKMAGTLSSQELNQMQRYMDDLPSLKIFIDEEGNLSVNEIRARARRLKREQNRLDLIIIDYIQLMRGNGGSKGNTNREQEISEISRSLKGLAKELDIPIVALAQLNRGVEQRQNKRPMPSDLRESGSLEQDADVIMMLYRDEFYNKDTKDKNTAEVIVVKHRNGETGTAKLRFYNDTMQFVSFSDDLL